MCCSNDIKKNKLNEINVNNNNNNNNNEEEEEDDNFTILLNEIKILDDFVLFFENFIVYSFDVRIENINQAAANFINLFINN